MPTRSESDGWGETGCICQASGRWLCARPANSSCWTFGNMQIVWTGGWRKSWGQWHFWCSRIDDGCEQVSGSSLLKPQHNWTMAGQWTTPSVCCRQAALALEILKNESIWMTVLMGNWSESELQNASPEINCYLPGNLRGWPRFLPWLDRKKRVGCLCKAARGAMTKGSLMIEVRGSDVFGVLTSSRSACLVSLVLPCPVNIVFFAVLARFCANSFNAPNVRE